MVNSTPVCLLSFKIVQNVLWRKEIFRFYIVKYMFFYNFCHQELIRPSLFQDHLILICIFFHVICFWSVCCAWTLFLQNLPQGGLGHGLQKNNSRHSLNVDWSFGKTIKYVLERGRERFYMFILYQFLTLHLVALSTCSFSERNVKWKKFLH